MKKVLKSRLTAGVLILIALYSGTALAEDVVVKEGTITADVFKDRSLVGYWHFNGTAMDSWKNENDGTFEGGAHAENGVLELDGVGDYVDCGNDSSLSLTNNFSISAWIYITDTSPGLLICKGNVGAYSAGGAYSILCIPGNGVVRFYVRNSNDTDFKYPFAAVPLNQWTHVVGTFSDGDIRIYKNGDFADDDTLGTTTIHSNDGPLGIGAEGDGGGLLWEGLIDDLMIFDRVLEDWEIRQLYRNPKRYGHFIKLYSDTLDVSGDISCDGDITALGKITGDPVDPSFVLYDSETRQGIIELAKATIPPNKQDGAALFFNKERKRLEIYVQSEGKFYDLQGNLIFSMPEPLVATTFKTRRYHLDTRTGEVRELQTVDAKSWRLKEGYEFDTETGKFYKHSIDLVNQVVTKEEVTKDEAIVFE